MAKEPTLKEMESRWDEVASAGTKVKPRLWVAQHAVCFEWLAHFLPSCVGKVHLAFVCEIIDIANLGSTRQKRLRQQGLAWVVKPFG
jgi:hypothetical protein